MLGKDLYKLESNVELTNDRLKSLVIFYRPLIGNDALVLYEYLVMSDSTYSYLELNSLLTLFNISIDYFENNIALLNKYKLVKTLKAVNEEKYIFVIKEPLSTNSFIKDNILIRNFILKVGGEYYQEIITGLNLIHNNHEGFDDISKKYDLDALATWNREYEEKLKLNNEDKKYNINSLFDINYFLKGVSTNLFPLKYRTYENLSEMAKLADLYNISYDKMRTYLPRVLKSDSNTFDLKLLRYLCMNSQTDYKQVNKGNYDVPVILFLMNLQDGKEVTEYDRKIIYKLANSYKLNPDVINVVLETTLKVCDNRLIEKYASALASDLHRNDIKTAKQALERIDKFTRTTTTVNNTNVIYDDSTNKKEDLSDIEEFLRIRGNNE